MSGSRGHGKPSKGVTLSEAVRLAQTTGDRVAVVSPDGITHVDPSNIKITSFALVSRCPYCGGPFDKVGHKRDGSECNHPTKIERIQKVDR